MHEPLFVGISFPLLNRNLWSLQRTPLLVELEQQLHQVLSTGPKDGGDILCKLLQTSWQLTSVLESMARKMLQMPGPGEIPAEENSG
jgi:hypothetical protein